jgi:nitric oxide reductase large subunit
MNWYEKNPSLPLKPDTTVEKHRRVKLTATGVAHAGAADQSIGVSRTGAVYGRSTDTATDLVPTWLHNQGGAPAVELASIVEMGGLVEPAADGKVTALDEGEPCGIALEAGGIGDAVPIAFSFTLKAPEAPEAPAPPPAS